MSRLGAALIAAAVLLAGREIVTIQFEQRGRTFHWRRTPVRITGTSAVKGAQYDGAHDQSEAESIAPLSRVTCGGRVFPLTRRR